MNILILGYGKMGRVIEQIAIERGHTIPYKINIDNIHEMASIDSKKVDVAIEFSSPEAAVNNLFFCFDKQIPVVCGTTGWLEKRTEVEKSCREKEGGLFYASNYSLGVNLFFHINEVLAGLMNLYPMYEVRMEEIHHTEKKDSPSGTAITLAEGVIKHLDRKKSWVNIAATNESELSIISKREGEVPGTHSITYDSTVDSIEIKHVAHNRQGFALGAVVAAEWMKGKKGVFGMQDMLKLK